MPWPDSFYWWKSSNVMNDKHGHHAKGQAKVHTVMSEFKEDSLHSGSGGKVTSRKQAVAIAMSEAGLSKKRRKA